MFYVFLGVVAGGIVLGAVYAHEAEHLRNAVDLLKAAKTADRKAVNKQMGGVKIE